MRVWVTSDSVYLMMTHEEALRQALSIIGQIYNNNPDSTLRSETKIECDIENIGECQRYFTIFVDKNNNLDIIKIDKKIAYYKTKNPTSGIEKEINRLVKEKQRLINLKSKNNDFI